MNPLLNLNTNLHLVKQVLLQRQLEFIQFLPLFLVPEGMFPPEVVIINSTAVRVIWTSPSNPNGVVTSYSVYVNNQQYKTGMSEPGSFLLADLSPFTVYDIQVRIYFLGCVTYFNFTYLILLGFPRKILFCKFRYTCVCTDACVHIHTRNIFIFSIFWFVYTFHHKFPLSPFSKCQNCIYFPLNALCFSISKTPTYITKRQRFYSYSLKENCNCLRNIRHA